MSRDFVLVGIPSYVNIPARVIASWLAQDGLDDCAWGVVEGAYLPAAMNGLTRKALQIGARRLVVLETDMVLPDGALRKMIDAVDPIVGALYFRQNPPHWPLVFQQEDPKDRGELRTYRSPTLGEIFDMIRRPGLYRCHAIGMGCTSIDVEVFRRIGLEGPWWWLRGDPYAHTGAGHDVQFCQAARDRGFGIWCDSSITCGHLKPVPIGPVQFEQAQVYEAARNGQVMTGPVADGKVEILMGRPVK
jgi:hypothetical protein